MFFMNFIAPPLLSAECWGLHTPMYEEQEQSTAAENFWLKHFGHWVASHEVQLLLTMKRQVLKRRSRYAAKQQKFHFRPHHLVVCVILFNVGCCFSSMYTLLPVERDKENLNDENSPFPIQMCLVDAFFFAGCILGLVLSSLLQQYASNISLSVVSLFLSAITSVVLGFCKSLEFVVLCRFCLGLFILMALDSLMSVSILSPSDHFRLMSSASVAFGYVVGSLFPFSFCPPPLFSYFHWMVAVHFHLFL